jgi:transcriptional regulator with XRE-family HTH domain
VKRKATEPSVGQFLRDEIKRSRRSLRDVADQADMHPAMLRMILAGSTKLPLDAVEPLARAVQADPIALLRLLLKQSMPESWSTIENRLAELVFTPLERRVVEAYRTLTKGREIAIFMFPARPHSLVVTRKAKR